MNIPQTSEDYPGAMLMLQEKYGYIRSIDVAAQLGGCQAGHLREAGYITMDSGSYTTLNDTGMERACTRVTSCSRSYLYTRALTRLPPARMPARWSTTSVLRPLRLSAHTQRMRDGANG